MAMSAFLIIVSMQNAVGIEMKVLPVRTVHMMKPMTLMTRAPEQLPDLVRCKIGHHLPAFLEFIRDPFDIVRLKNAQHH
ncbi:MAG: hypothetical protein K2F64_04880, partial [Muribaculaceae bacterium]|nr:hypothetical protein [Muribaculaceae bacterium]